MTKAQILPNVRLIPEAIAKLDKHLTGPEGIFSAPPSTYLKLTMPERITWEFEEFNHFFVEYPQSLFASYRRVNNGHEVLVENFADDHGPGTHISVRAPNAVAIDTIFAIIEEYLPQSTSLIEAPKRCRRPHPRARTSAKASSNQRSPA